MTIQLTDDEVQEAVRQWFFKNHPSMAIEGTVRFYHADDFDDDIEVVARFEVITEDKPVA